MSCGTPFATHALLILLILVILVLVGRVPIGL
jgi:hypothetical protein